MPLWLIKEVINKLKDTRYFNKLDLTWKYNNIQIKEEKWMESNILDQQESIQAKSDILCIIQFTGNILINNE